MVLENEISAAEYDIVSLILLLPTITTKVMDHREISYCVHVIIGKFIEKVSSFGLPNTVGKEDNRF